MSVRTPRATIRTSSEPAAGKQTAMDVGPVELIVLRFPDQRADPATTAVLTDAASRGYITVLDAVFVTRTSDGLLRVADDVEDMALGTLQIRRQALISEGDLELVRNSLPPGTSALVVVYEHRWTRHLASTAGQSGGDVALHVQVPRDALAAAMDAAAT